MGNCLIIRDKVVKVVKPDGKILEYRSPITALDVTSKFSGHEVSETSATARSSLEFLRPEAKLRGGNIYYLVPLKPREGGSVKSKKKVRFSEPEKEYLVKEEKEEKSKVVRIKVVISKQELQELLRKGGVSSIGDMVTQLQNSDEKRIVSLDNSCDDHDHHSCDEHDGNRVVY